MVDPCAYICSLNILVRSRFIRVIHYFGEPLQRAITRATNYFVGVERSYAVFMAVARNLCAGGGASQRRAGDASL